MSVAQQRRPPRQQIELDPHPGALTDTGVRLQKTLKQLAQAVRAQAASGEHVFGLCIQSRHVNAAAAGRRQVDPGSDLARRTAPLSRVGIQLQRHMQTLHAHP